MKGRCVAGKEYIYDNQQVPITIPHGPPCILSCNRYLNPTAQQLVSLRTKQWWQWWCVTVLLVLFVLINGSFVRKSYKSSALRGPPVTTPSQRLTPHGGNFEINVSIVTLMHSKWKSLSLKGLKTTIQHVCGILQPHYKMWLQRGVIW